MTLVLDIYRAGTLLVARVTVRQLRVADDGAVAGQIRAPIGDEEALFEDTGGPLRFVLPDGRPVEFTIYQAGNATQWGKFNGRIAG